MEAPGDTIRSLNQPNELVPTAAESKQELLKIYPKKVRRKRATQIILNDPGERRRRSAPTPGPFQASSPSAAAPTPAARAWCSGPIRDILQITHGPIGCGYYRWLTRRNQTCPTTRSAPKTS